MYFALVVGVDVEVVVARLPEEFGGGWGTRLCGRSGPVLASELIVAIAGVGDGFERDGGAGIEGAARV